MLSRRTLARHLHINQLMRKNSVGNRLTIKQFAICHLLRRKTWPIARQNTAFRTAVCRISQTANHRQKGQTNAEIGKSPSRIWTFTCKNTTNALFLQHEY